MDDLAPTNAPAPIDVEVDDARVDRFRGIRDRELRGTLGLHAIESERVVRRFLVAAIRRRSEPMPPALEPHALLATPDAIERLSNELAEATRRFPHLAIHRVADERALHAITGYTMHSGAVALGVRHADGTVDELVRTIGSAEHARGPGRTDLLLALDGVTQTDNVGAIFRNAASFGARGVLLSPRASDPFLRKTLRVSMGRALNLPWARADAGAWPEALDRIRRELGYAIVAAEDSPGAIDLARLAPPPRAVVVVGAEQDGVSPEILAMADAVVRIPMDDLGGALALDPPSLNVSIASAVVLHAMRAQPRA